jgi:hypothetical protein
MRAKVVDSNDFEKDLKTGALINVNASQYQMALQRKYQYKKNQEEKKELRQTIDDLIAICKNLQEQINDLKKSL